jgi:hypothetical protein
MPRQKIGGIEDMEKLVMRLYRKPYRRCRGEGKGRLFEGWGSLRNPQR